MLIAGLACPVLFASPATAQEVASASHGLDGSALGLLWAAPFIGILLSIAVIPHVAPYFWDDHFGKLAIFWALALAVPLVAVHGLNAAGPAIVHSLLREYLPFIIVLMALYTIAGGIHIRGSLHGSPGVNAALLALGAGAASFIGTTGASMLMIRPVIRANDDRRHNAHVIVFFIFLVSNIGGALTPLGDPPLFIGYLLGVDFFWPLKHVWAPTLVVTAILLVLFLCIDSYYYAREGHLSRDLTPDAPLGIDGKINLLLLTLLVAVVLASGSISSFGVFHVLSVEVSLKDLSRDSLLLMILVASIKLTPPRVHQANSFDWRPALEVAKLFAGIFVTITPVIAILHAGSRGAMAPLLALLSHADGSPHNFMYFWIAGGLSACLDNAPTYLVLFHAAGGKASELMGTGAATLAAISAGSVFMGAATYIGNAPNFMVKAIAVQNGVNMPSFLGYLAWTGAILIPTFLLVSCLFFR